MSVGGEHAYQVVEQRIAMVARSVADDRDGQYRPAMAGEPLVPVLWEDMACIDEGCDETMTGWRTIRSEDMYRVERAMNSGCDGVCGCHCHA